MKKTLISITLSFTISLVSCFLPNIEPQISDEAFQAVASQARDMQKLLEETEAKNNRVYAEFEQQKILYRDNFSRMERPYNSARNLREQSWHIVSEIEEMKISLVMQIEKRSRQECENTNNWFREKEKWMSLSVAHSFLSEGKKPAQIKKMLEEYKARLFTDDYLLSPRDTYRIKLNIHTGKVKKKSWESHYFKNRPAFSAMYELIRIQHTVRNAEREMLGYLWQNLGNSCYKFDAIKAVIIPHRTEVALGDTFSGDVGLLAYLFGGSPDIRVKNGSVSESTEGTSTYREKATQKGKNTVEGHILIYDPQTGERIGLPFETEYFVK